MVRLDGPNPFYRKREWKRMPFESCMNLMDVTTILFMEFRGLKEDVPIYDILSSHRDYLHELYITARSWD